MIVKCTKYPHLDIYDLGVKFEKGITEVTDPKIIKLLREMDRVYGFEFNESEKPK